MFVIVVPYSMDKICETPARYLETHETVTLESSYSSEYNDSVETKFMRCEYYWNDGTLSIAVYDYELNEWISEVNASSFEDAEKTLRTITEQHPGKIEVEEMLGIWKVYFTVAPDSLHYEGEITPNLENTICETCGDYEDDSYEFLYIPACPGTPMDKASILLNWSYGCYGWESAAGEFSEKADEVLSLLREIRSGGSEETKKDVSEAIEYLLKVMEQNTP